jgi:hypothetical protein
MWSLQSRRALYANIYHIKEENMKKRSNVVIIAAVIGLIGAIIAAIIIARCSKQPDPKNNVTSVNTPDTNNFVKDTQPIEQSVAPPVQPPVENNDLNFRGWYLWGTGLQVKTNKNTVTFNGRVVTEAGYVNERLDRSLKNKTIILEFRNISSSNFSEERLIKITVNADDQLVNPIGITDLILGEYIPVDYDKAEFVLPNNFDGKIGFVFYQADLRNLEITAYYK